VKVPSINNEPA